jgi:hypothetical protein
MLVTIIKEDICWKIAMERKVKKRLTKNNRNAITSDLSHSGISDVFTVCQSRWYRRMAMSCPLRCHDGNLAISLALVCLGKARVDGRYHRQQLCRRLHDDPSLDACVRLVVHA